MTEAAFDKLRLIRSPYVGPVSYRQLIARFGDAGKALEALPNIASRGGASRFSVASASVVRHEIERSEQLGARHIFLDDEDYPALLAEMDNGPAVITVRGDLGLAARKTVAIVGARNASAAGCRFARQLSQELSESGITVISGLARGIDTAAHQGALAGGTVGVIAGGIDNSYPPENAELQERIAREGLLIAEMPPGTEPRARHFPHRNRIIAGLSLGTLVVEAVPKSGSLITARLAAEIGRDVMAVPGSPLDPRAQGCNHLIRDGATLVQNAADIVEAIGSIAGEAIGRAAPKNISAILADADDVDRQCVVALLGPTPVSIDELVRQSRVPTEQVQLVLVELELAGKLVRHAGAMVALC